LTNKNTYNNLPAIQFTRGAWCIC